MSPEQVYLQQVEKLVVQSGSLQKKRNRITWARFFILTSMVAVSVWAYPFSVILTITIVVISLGLVWRLSTIDAGYEGQIYSARRLEKVIRKELSIAAGGHKELPGGMEFIPASHDYAFDLDLFGRSSIYQYINRTTSAQGNKTLANWLLSPSTAEAILLRQEAVRELASQIEWCQQLQAFGIEKKITFQTEKKIVDWLQTGSGLEGNRPWNTLRRAFPVLSIGVTFLYIYNEIPGYVFYLCILAFFLLSMYISRIMSPRLRQIRDIEIEISILGKSIVWLEKKDWQSAYLRQLSKDLTAGDAPASGAIRKLAVLLGRIDRRWNPLFFLPVSTFLLLDLQIIFQLEAWRSRYGAKLAGWFSILGELEAIASIATCHHNHPDWVFPSYVPGPGILNTTDVGHPLIPAGKRVCNSFSISGHGKLALITGSNMAGKSTFLRSIGVNIVLANMGAPVCAAAMTLSHMRVISSMRIVDNLEENTSTFYAELKQLKRVIEAIEKHENVFILLDEVLRGTNSFDRHTGSAALIRQMMQQDAVGMLATHDLELTNAATEFAGRIENYHFDIQVRGDELFFDYQLKKGICSSMNASILMKAIGIKL